MSVPYPFTANSSSHTNSGSRPVQYPRLQQQGQSQDSAMASIPRRPSQQRGYYAQSPSNSPSTTSLLPPSARAPQTVQAAFAKGPTLSLRSMPSSSDLVRFIVIAPIPCIESLLPTIYLVTESFSIHWGRYSRRTDSVSTFSF
jgi:hypothetical protein